MASLAWAVLLLAGMTCTNAIGEEIAIENWPSAVQVEFNIATLWRRQCGGSIITNYHALSSATCFRNLHSTRRIRAGTALNALGGVLREVSSVVQHPDFGNNGNEGDLAIVRVDISWWFSNAIQPIPILPQGYWLPAGVYVTMAGWGVTAAGGMVPNNLNRALLQTKPSTTCVNQFPGRVTENMLCLGLSDATGRDFDPSDAGSPVLYGNALAAVLSFGHSKRNELPVVSISVGAYSNWIVANAS